jgi:hypothetical protein
VNPCVDLYLWIDVLVCASGWKCARAYLSLQMILLMLSLMLSLLLSVPLRPTLPCWASFSFTFSSDFVSHSFSRVISSVGGETWHLAVWMQRAIVLVLEHAVGTVGLFRICAEESQLQRHRTIIESVAEYVLKSRNCRSCVYNTVPGAAHFVLLSSFHLPCSVHCVLCAAVIAMAVGVVM